MAQTKILITGATGYTTETLIEQVFSVRTLVHRQDERSEQLRSTGAESTTGDMLNLNHVREALEGVSAAYFVYPIHPGLIEASAYFAAAAKEAGIAAIVNMSQISARRESKSDAARDHWISERVFDWSGVPVTHLRPTFSPNSCFIPALSPRLPITGVSPSICEGKTCSDRHGRPG